MSKSALGIDQIKAKLAKYCAYQERCTNEVLKKMEDLQLSEDLMIELIRWLTKENFIDDERYAKQYVRGKFHLKHWGRVKIKYELRKKGIVDRFVAVSYTHLTLPTTSRV